MAKQLDKTRVRMGNLIKVANQGRRHNESAAYYAVKLETQDGRTEFWCMFTGKEVARLFPVEIDGDRDLKLGRLYYRHRIGATVRHFVRLLLPAPEGTVSDAGTCVVMLSQHMIDKGRARADRNAEDVPRMSWLQNLKD